jgi:CHAD domain-containing protein/adenylate cyclase class IV
VNGARAYDRSVRTTVERELKLDVDGSFELPPLEGEALPARIFTSTYHDTPSRSLQRAGITLRRRLENGKSLWQLKLPRSDAARSELEEPGGPVHVPRALGSLLQAHLRHGALEPVATLRTRRAGVRVLDGERRVADVTVDNVDVLDAGRAAGGFAEVEVELLDGNEADLDRLGRRLRRAGARRSDGIPKLYRVLPPPQDAAAPAPDAPLRDHLRHLLEVQLAELEARDPGVRLGDEAEDVHRFRVATRRTRALVRATRPLLGDALAPLGEELRWLAGLLGPVRDLDVLLDHLGAEVATLDTDERAGRELLTGLEGAREEARQHLLAALASPRYRSLLEAFAAAIATLPRLRKGASADALARDAFRRLRLDAEKLPTEPSDQELHRLRIEAKRARYAAELAALGGASSAKRSVDALKRLQDVVGEHQDAVVAEERLRGLSRARTAVAAGRLIERERDRRRAMRAEYPETLAAALRAGRKAFG